MPAGFDPVADLRGALAARHALESGNDHLVSLEDPSGRTAQAYGLVYPADVLDNTGLAETDVARLGAAVGVNI